MPPREGVLVMSNGWKTFWPPQGLDGEIITLVLYGLVVFEYLHEAAGGSGQGEKGLGMSA